MRTAAGPLRSGLAEARPRVLAFARSPRAFGVGAAARPSVALEMPAQFNIASWFLDRPATEHPDCVAILGEPREVRYAELREVMNRCGNALRAMGCATGDRVLIVLPDSAEFIAAFFAAAKIGAIAVPVNSFARASDYAHSLSNSGARIAIVHADVLPDFLPAAEGKGIQLLVVGSDSADSRGIRWQDWIASSSADLAQHATAATDPAFILYTSGSGGQPKGVVHSHKDMLIATRCYAESVLGIHAEDRIFSVSKLFFAYGLGNGMYFPLAAGATTILNPERTRVENVVAILARRRPTIFFAVPTFFAALLHESARGLTLDFSSVRFAVSAGEPLPAEIFTQFRERFGVEILDGIGSTEMLHIFISNSPGHAHPGTCGKPVPGYRARILDDSQIHVATGDIGNLWVQGESAFAGYWNIPELSARTKQDGWVKTGDKFSCDADGHYHYCGRADDMLKVSGMWVSPAETENALLADARVAEAAVVGALDPLGLTTSVAYIVLRGEFTPNAEISQTILDALRSRLVHYKCPREIRFIDELPKTATGKIQRFLLRDQLNARKV
jgi:benzoate-CoA ligase family protein